MDVSWGGGRVVSAYQHAESGDESDDFQAAPEPEDEAEKHGGGGRGLDEWKCCVWCVGNFLRVSREVDRKASCD